MMMCGTVEEIYGEYLSHWKDEVCRKTLYRLAVDREKLMWKSSLSVTGRQLRVMFGVWLTTGLR